MAVLAKTKAVAESEADSAAKPMSKPDRIDSRLLAVARWAALTAVLAVAVVAAISEKFYSQDLTPSAGLLVTLFAAVVGAIVSAVALLRHY